MPKLLRACVGLFALISCAHAESSSAPLRGENEAVGLFTLACIQLAGNPAAVRNFMNQKNVRELTPTAREAIMPNRRGVGFDASTKETRLALISEDNGWCSVFAETVDVSKIIPLVEHVAQINHLTLVRTGKQEKGGLTSHNFKLTIKDHVFTLGVSIGTRPGAPFHAFLTLAP